MKIAIIGSSPLALEAALRFHSHGAALTFFSLKEAGFKSEAIHSFVSELGIEYLGSIEKSTSIKDWHKDYFEPLTTFIKAHHRVRPHEVLSVTKRYLAPYETPSQGSRFQDLFRVIYQVNPQEFILEQKESNPETYQRLTEEFVSSLQSTIEMYEDFDLVLDLRKETLCSSVAITGRALGEKRVSQDALFYGFEALDEAKKIALQNGPERELALVGSHELAAETLMELEGWLKDPRSRLFIVSEEPTPFEYYLRRAVPEKSQKLKSILDYFVQEFKKESEDFHQKLREWQDLDDFVQVKVPKPAEPIPRLVFFSGHNATAVDQLIDKRRLFLTLEKPEFREGLIQAENNALELKTIGVDKVLVATRFERSEIKIGLRMSEKGYFEAVPACTFFTDAWKCDLDQLKGIEDEIFKLFSPRDSH